MSGDYLLRCPACGLAIEDHYTSACPAGLSATVKVQDAAELAAVCRDRVDGPLFIHVLIRPGNTQVPNIPLPPEAIRDRFIGAL